MPASIKQFINSNDNVNDVLSKIDPESKYSFLREKLHHINDLLGDNKLHLSKFKDFNDPLEGKILMKKDDLKIVQKNRLEEKNLSFLHKQKKISQLARGLAKLKGDSYLYSPLDDRTIDRAIKYGVSCFCDNCSEIPMWSYYANNHQGLCVRFKINLPEDMINELKRDKLYMVDFSNQNIANVILGKVTYGNSLIQCELSDFDGLKIKTRGEHLSFTKSERKLLEAINTKSSCWEHEQEYRLIMFQFEHSIHLEKILNGNLDNKPLLKIDKVILGANMPSSVQNLIQRSYTNLIFGKAAIDYYNLKVLDTKLK